MAEQKDFDFDTREAVSAQDAPSAEPTALDDDHGPLRSLMDRNFLEYASYVICDRAIPALEDGLKPVQRRILWALKSMDDGRFIKVANVVGHCMQYHPHGDASIAEALVGLVNKSYLIEGQGNFGNVHTGDAAAAPRYIECRLTDLAREQLFNDELTDRVPTYDGRHKEPLLLPVKLPLLFMLGAEGIAVGMSTRVLPHNFAELLEAQIAILQDKPFELWPDFVTGGLMDVGEYERGNGRVRVRARIEQADEEHLVIRELPFGVTTESLIASIEDAVRKRRVAVKSINDYTADKVEIQLVLRANSKPDRTLKALYAFTQCEVSISPRFVVIHESRPVEMNVHDGLRIVTARLVDTLTRELKLRRKELEEARHHKTLVQLFIEERLYKKIEECRTSEAVQKAVLDGLAPFRDRLQRDVTAADVDMLLGIRIRRISRFDIEKNRKEIEGIVKELAGVAKDLADPTAYAIRYVKKLLRDARTSHPRRTEIASFETVERRELTSSELELCYDKDSGYLGFQVKGELLLQCSSYDKIILVWKDGRYRMTEPPEKLFVDKNLIYCAKFERERVMTVVYTLDQFSYLKRFQFGGCILNREYRCAPDGSNVRLLDDSDPENIYVNYRPAKRQRIHQQCFRAHDVPVKNVKAKGNNMTGKSIARLTTRRPRTWDDNASPRGVTLDF